MITLHSNKRGSSPYSRKGHIVLEEKGLPYKKINTDPEHLPEDFGSLNPNLRVSLLIDGDKCIFESDNIVDYLLRTYPGSKPPPGQPPLAVTITRPEHHFDDAKILVTIETILDSAVHNFLLTDCGVDPAEIKPWGWVWTRDPGRIQSCLDWLDQQATPEGFAPGLFSIMDLNLMCALTTLTRFGDDSWRERKNLAGVFDYFQNRPSVLATVP